MNSSGPYGSDIPNSSFIAFMATCLLLNNAIREQIENAMKLELDIHFHMVHYYSFPPQSSYL